MRSARYSARKISPLLPVTYVFCVLNTNALEFDYSSAVPNIQFIREEGDHVPEGVEKTVVAMHAGPFSEQFNNNIAEYFQYYLREMPDLQFCVYGHGHNISVDEFFDDGIKYYECTCAKKRSYLFFTLNSNGYTYEVVNFSNCCWQEEWPE